MGRTDSRTTQHRTPGASQLTTLLTRIRNRLEIRNEWALPIFLCMALGFGVILILMTPPFQVPDEIVHFYRAFAISEGHVVMEKQAGAIGADMPVSIHAITAVSANLPFHGEERQDRKALRAMLQRPLQPESRTFIQVSGAANYAPVPYLPHILGIWAGRLFDAPALVLLYLARLFGLIAYLLLAGLAIHLLPWGKWFMALLALLPMSLTEAMGVSADSVTMGLSFLLFALVMRRIPRLRDLTEEVGVAGRSRGLAAEARCKTGIPAGEWMIFLLLSAMLPLCKNLYILLLGLMPLLPLSLLELRLSGINRIEKSGRSATGNRRHGHIPKKQPGQTRELLVQEARRKTLLQALFLSIGILLCAAVALGVFFLWNRTVAGFSTDTPIAGADPASQVLFMMQHPGKAFRILTGSMTAQLSVNLRSMIGVLGWLDTPLPFVVYRSFYVLLLGLALLDGPGGSPWALSAMLRGGKGKVALRGQRPLPNLGVWGRLWTALLFLGIACAVYGSLYVVWSPVGGQEVSGVQGRYFIPVMPLLAAAVGYRPFRDWIRIKGLMLCLILPLWGITLHTVYMRYWGP